MKYDFQKYKLSEVGEVIAGGTPKTAVSEYWDGDIAWITPKDLSNYNQRYISKGERSITTEGLKNSSAKLMPKNAILFTSRAPIGYIAIADNDISTNQGFKSIVCNEGKCHYMYLYYWLKNNVEMIKSRSGGSTFQEVSGSVMKDIDIELPEVKIQKKIAYILNSIDNKIEHNNQISENLNSLSELLYKQWFVDFDFPNEEGLPYKASGAEMADSEIGLIPKGWRLGVLGDIADISSGKRPVNRSEIKNEESNFPLVGASSIMGYTSQYNYDQAILVIGRVGTHGIVQRFNSKVWASDNTLVIKSDYYEFVSNILSKIDYKALNRGSTQPLITQTDIKNQRIILPPKSILDSFEALVSKSAYLADNNKLQNESLANLRDTLLPKLLNGEINLDNLDIDN